jgi:hypothetical protein
MDDLPPIIRLSTAIIDREARLIIEWDQHIPGRINVDNGQHSFYYEGDDAQLLWKFYHPKAGEWKDPKADQWKDS